jgi:hypothetical protein
MPKGYGRGVLIALAVIAALLALVGVAFVGVTLYRGETLPALVALAVAVVGLYAMIGILKEMYSLEFVTHYAADLTDGTKQAIVAKLLTANSRSFFRLVSAVLALVGKATGGAKDK